jgi:non-heme chloroperoxidase
MWEYQLAILPRHGFRVIVYDRRGFGRSDKPWNGCDYSSPATDLNDLLEALDLKEVMKTHPMDYL